MCRWCAAIPQPSPLLTCHAVAFSVAHEKWGILLAYNDIAEYGLLWYFVSIPVYLLLWDLVFYVLHLALHIEPVRCPTSGACAFGCDSLGVVR